MAYSECLDWIQVAHKHFIYFGQVWISEVRAVKYSKLKYKVLTSKAGPAGRCYINGVWVNLSLKSFRPVDVQR